ncbi:Hypothetical protein PP7435_CHR4-0042 [Komagataella phaffii CBS 7435]|uniref:Uncharacterized protein n=1 Tax=Komagataella phaffii (strain ATCC 76273 / CBS 7435 / CECT 11047 / NRRL Y-11430 / Wegner 21-1) TaxID=981350 RepID=F2QXU4_KOMPC|nr:Hypothetical protein BQ9382_C4-0178 [Komagataella phaffii CBS 7435]CCA40222.1 Hypothetical protein PP7435_CHR4-0042 [Komagataella phaffii CBS 7435]
MDPLSPIVATPNFNARYSEQQPGGKCLMSRLENFWLGCGMTPETTLLKKVRQQNPVLGIAGVVFGSVGYGMALRTQALTIGSGP